jgi:two-component system, NtrC family, nitrogen regulation sensor histidine kinase NtrY
MVSEKLLNNKVWILMLITVAILFTGSGFSFAHSLYWISAGLMITGVILIISLIRVYNATNESVSIFFESLKNDDTAVHFTSDLNNRTLTDLYKSINSVNKHFQEIKLRNEYNESYYKTLIHHASTGILVLNADNRIELINKAACIYAGISYESTNLNLLKIKHPAFFDAVCKLKPGETTTYRNMNSGNLQILFFRAAMIKRNDSEMKLVSIQDIRYELESRELESYRKLISVMTHEIMNLLSPLTSVAKELYSMFRREEVTEGVATIEESKIRTAVNGLQLINDQSNGLMNFVNNYRRISKIPQPEFSSFTAGEWFEQIRIAFGGRMKENNIDFRIIADRSYGQIVADKNLLNQVIINLLNNAIDAVIEVEDERWIEIRGMKSVNDKYLIKVVNSGPLILPELLEKIFVPFFTTKKNGSGIGLSISNEIMKRHNGSLVAISTTENNTCFMMEF